MSVWIVVVAAGSGTRFGGPKQYELLGSTRIIDRSVATACRAADHVVLVVAADDLDDVRTQFATYPSVLVTAGGSTRSASVRGGLAVIPNDAEVIVVHDAARPLASDELFERVIAAVRAGADAAVPGIAVADTLRHRAGGVVDREGVVAVQTPQAFRADTLLTAHTDESDASDDATLVEAIGGKVVIVSGETTNFKITTAHDLMVARMLVAEGDPS
jgi:2-C-methyl-D-erythritol 4-phosphate cytidylyltransferase